MMLQALVAYADREGLGDLDFEARPVDYELRIDRAGQFIGLVGLDEGKQRRFLSRLPAEPPSRNNPGFPAFVVDKAQYVLGLAKPGEKAGNAKKSFDSYVALIAEAADSTKDEGLEAIRAFVKSAGEMERACAALAEREPKPEGRDGKVLVPTLASGAIAQRIHERETVASWWSAARASEHAKKKGAGVARCLDQPILRAELTVVRLGGSGRRGSRARGTTTAGSSRGMKAWWSNIEARSFGWP